MLEKFAPVKAVLALVEAQKEYSIRELARRARIGIGTAKQCLDWLLSKKIVNRGIIGRTHQYSFNLDSILARQVKILVSLNAIQDSGLVEEIQARMPVSSVVLYGSVARGDDKPESDIDLLVISRKPARMTGLKSQKSLTREITIVCHRLAEWRKKARTAKPFYDRVISEGIALCGELPVVV